MMHPVVERALTTLIDTTEKIGALAWEQSPLLLHDLLVHGMIVAGGVVVISVLNLSLCAWFAYRIRTFIPKFAADDTIELWIGCILSGAVGLLFAWIGVVDLLTIWLAPRAYLMGLVK